jgi:hypothetical protein
MDHLPHSPYLALANFWLFSELKEYAEREVFLEH